MTEYIFPKSDGDVFYDGDANLMTTAALANVIENRIASSKSIAGWSGLLSVYSAGVIPGTYMTEDMVVDSFQTSTANTATGFTSAVLPSYSYDAAANIEFNGGYPGIYFDDETASFSFISNLQMHTSLHSVSGTANNVFVHFSYDVLALIDSFGNSSLAAGWQDTSSGGTITEGDEHVDLAAGAGQYARMYYNAKDYFQTSDRIYAYFIQDTSNGNGTSIIGFTNGTTYVPILTKEPTGTYGYYGFVMIHLQGTTNRAHVYLNHRFVASVDLSTVTTNWYIYFQHTGGASAGDTQFHFVADDTISSQATTITHYISSDGGANYETLSGNNAAVKINNPGTNIVAKMDGTLDSGEMLILYGWGAIRLA